MHHHVVFQRKPNLQRETDQQAQVRRSKHAARGMRKQNDAEIVLAGLKTDGCEIANTFGFQNLSELFKAGSGKGRQRFRHFGKIAKAYKSAAPVCQLGNVFSSAAAFNLLQKFG